METATQALNRLTSLTWDWYLPSRDDPDLVWTVPADDPRVLQDLETNDLARFPWFYKRYAEPLPRVALPRDLPRTTAPAVAVLAGTVDVAPTGLDLPHLSPGRPPPRRSPQARIRRGCRTARPLGSSPTGATR